MTRRPLICLKALLALFIAVPSGFAVKRPSEEMTLLVVPARYTALQVAFDVVEKRKVVLVSYESDVTTQEVLIHAWNGKEWVYVALEDYSKAAFLRFKPSRAVLIGDEQLLPETVVEGTTWCPFVMGVPSIDKTILINSLGKVFSFSKEEWHWFSERYSLGLSDLNEARRRDSWYDHPYIEPETKPTEILPAEVLSSEEDFLPLMDDGVETPKG